MPFVQTGEMLEKAQQGSYAVGAFNAENMEMVQAIIAAAEAENAPVIIQTTPGTLKYAGPKCFASLVGRLAKDAAVPVALHLDHGNSYELAEECAREGYTSLMIDGSKLPFDGNVEITQGLENIDLVAALQATADSGGIFPDGNGHQFHFNTDLFPGDGVDRFLNGGADVIRRDVVEGRVGKHNFVIPVGRGEAAHGQCQDQDEDQGYETDSLGHIHRSFF